MSRKEYIMRALKALDDGQITEIEFDVMILNTSRFCDNDGNDADDDAKFKLAIEMAKAVF